MSSRQLSLLHKSFIFLHKGLVYVLGICAYAYSAPFRFMLLIQGIYTHAEVSPDDLSDIFPEW